MLPQLKYNVLKHCYKSNRHICLTCSVPLSDTGGGRLQGTVPSDHRASESQVHRPGPTKRGWPGIDPADHATHDSDRTHDACDHAAA